MLLTEQEIDECFTQPIKSFFGKSRYDIAESLESAVLAKLKAQEPVAWMTEDKQDDEIGMDVEGSPETLGWTESFPVYRHPLPPDDVVRDAERYRWLRDENDDPELYLLTAPEELDAAVDAAMKEMK